MLVYVRNVLNTVVMGVHYNPTVLVKFEERLYELPFSEVRKTSEDDIFVVDDSLLNYETLVDTTRGIG